MKSLKLKTLTILLLLMCAALVIVIVLLLWKNMPGNHRTFTSRIVDTNLVGIDDDSSKFITLSNGLKVTVGCGFCAESYRGKVDHGLKVGDEVTVKAYIEDWGVYNTRTEASYMHKKNSAVTP